MVRVGVHAKLLGGRRVLIVGLMLGFLLVAHLVRTGSRSFPAGVILDFRATTWPIIKEGSAARSARCLSVRPLPTSDSTHALGRPSAAKHALVLTAGHGRGR